MRILFLIWVVFMLATMHTYATPLDLVPHRARGGKIYKLLQEKENTARISLGLAAPNTTVNILQQYIYYGNATKGKFSQRWWQDTSFWITGGPIFLYVSGEGPASSSPSGYTAAMGKQFNALLLTLEHRYYGESLPAALTDSETLQNTLSVEAELADLASFVNYIQTSVYPSQMPHQWVVIGGSYAGGVASWFRNRYPDLVMAAWSSSGVVNAMYNFTAFDQQIVSDLPSDCLEKMRAVTVAAESAWEDPFNKTKLLKLFGTPSYFTQGDFMWMLADSGAMGPQYGFKDTMCSIMTSPLFLSPLEAFANWTLEHYGTSFPSNCYYSTECLSNRTYSDEWASGGYPWVWQCCSELAYWQVASPGSIRSSLINISYFTNQCKSAFGPNTNADTVAFNNKYGGAAPNITNVIATQGSDDPWQGAGVERALRESYPEFTAVCDGCGHCGDLYSPQSTDPTAIVVQRQAIASYLQSWLNISASAVPSLAPATGQLGSGAIAGIVVASLVGQALIIFAAVKIALRNRAASYEPL